MHTHRPLRGLVAALLTVATAAIGLVGTSAAPASAGPPPVMLSIVAGTGSNEFPPKAGPALESPISPAGIAFDSAGNMIVADFAYSRVVRITPSGTLSIIAGNGTYGGPVPGPALNSPMGAPAGVAIDSQDNIFVADYDKGYIYKVTPGGTLSIFAGTGDYGTPTPGPATSSSIPGAWGLAIDSADNLYIGEQGTRQVLKVTPGGTLSVFAGNTEYGRAIPGPALDSKFTDPRSLAVDSSDNVYIGDAITGQVLKVTPGGTLSVYAGTNLVSWSGLTNGVATEVPLGNPYELAMDASDNLYIGDDGNYQIAKVTPGGTLTVIAGTHNQGTPLPGPALSSPLNGFQGMAVGPDGVLYHSDYGSRYLVRLSASGLPTVPGYPISPTAVAGDRTSTVTFTVPFDGGSSITGYVMKIGASAWTNAPCNVVGSTATCTLTNLTNYTTPPVIFRAVNAIGASSFSAPVAVRPRLTGATITSVTTTSWSAKVSFTGVTIPASRFKGYTATAYEAGTNRRAGNCQSGPKGAPCIITGLNSGTSYDFRVVGYFRFNSSNTVPRETLPSNTVTVSTKN